MVNCPKCGGKETIILKSWQLAPLKQAATTKTPPLQVGVFKCQKCEQKFRSQVNVQTKSSPQPSLVNSIEKIKEIQSGLTLTLNNLRQQIRRFESERPNVLCEIEGLKKDVESRASDLEVEVDQLRENLKSLKDLLGFSEESP